MPLARCPKCGRTFPNTLREFPGCGYSPFVRPRQGPPQEPASQDAPPQGTPPQGMPPQGMPPQGAPVQGMPPQGADLFEMTEAEDETPSLLRRLLLPALLVVALLLAGLSAWLYFSHRKPPEPEPDPVQEAPVYCAEDAHVWADATCTQPKTCTVCGKTEGEPLGHEFEDNICTRCGAYDRMFVFSEFNSKRSGGAVVFSGVVRNYSPLPVKNLHAKLELFDEDKKLVTTAWAYLFEEPPLDAYESGQWRFSFDDTGFTWKYWSVSIMGYELAQ